MSIQLFFADKLIRLTVKRRFAKKPDIMTLRELMAGMQPPKVPPSVRIESTKLGGVATERLATPAASTSHAILYIHGGGFVGGSPLTHRALTWRLAEKTAAPVYAVDYRLAPEHAFPAGLDDCVAAYRGLLESGISPASLAVGGDSAGGNLALALCLRVKTLGLAQPAALFCLSPVTDLAGEPESRQINRRSDALFDARSFPTVIDRYCPGRDAADPLLSPLRGDVSGFPPTLLQCSGSEMLRDDSVLMAEHLENARVEVKLEIWPSVFHVWQIAADTIPESRKAIDKIVAFVTSHWTAQSLRAA